MKITDYQSCKRFRSIIKYCQIGKEYRLRPGAPGCAGNESYYIKVREMEGELVIEDNYGYISQRDIEHFSLVVEVGGPLALLTDTSNLEPVDENPRL